MSVLHRFYFFNLVVSWNWNRIFCLSYHVMIWVIFFRMISNYLVFTHLFIFSSLHILLYFKHCIITCFDVLLICSQKQNEKKYSETFFWWRKTVKFILSDYSWTAIELCALDKFWCSLSILLFSSAMFSSFQNDFLTAHLVFHQWRSFCLLNLSRSCLELSVRVMSEINQNLIQSVKNDLK